MKVETLYVAPSLSHPVSLLTSSCYDKGTHAATMTTLLRLLEPESSSSASSDKPVIFIVDGFDLFALHPRQSFLYCLLDIVQGNKRRAGVGVIGISSRTVSTLPLLCETFTDSLALRSGLSVGIGEASSFEMSIACSANRRRERLHRLRLPRSLTSSSRNTLRLGCIFDEFSRSLEQRSRCEFTTLSSHALANRSMIGIPLR